MSYDERAFSVDQLLSYGECFFVDPEGAFVVGFRFTVRYSDGFTELCMAFKTIAVAWRNNGSKDRFLQVIRQFALNLRFFDSFNVVILRFGILLPDLLEQYGGTGAIIWWGNGLTETKERICNEQKNGMREPDHFHPPRFPEQILSVKDRELHCKFAQYPLRRDKN